MSGIEPVNPGCLDEMLRGAGSRPLKTEILEPIASLRNDGRCFECFKHLLQSYVSGATYTNKMMQMQRLANQMGSGEIQLPFTIMEEDPSAIADAVGDLISDTPDANVDWLHKVSANPNRGFIDPLPITTQYAKRVLDILGAMIGILLLWPLVILTAFAVKISSPGDTIFSQQRVGLNRRNRESIDRRESGAVIYQQERRDGETRRQCKGYGRVFTLYKFRTMVNDAEKNGAQFAVENDPRVTRLGRFMRKTRIDELPQLWNVLRGDMSLVGPRPERPEFIEDLSAQIPGYLDRLQLKPGLTGLAQIENGYDNDIESFKRKVAYDLLYLRHCCLMNDIKILLRTTGVVLTGKGAL